MKRKVWVQIATNPLRVVRIFKNQRAASLLVGFEDIVRYILKASAVGNIRKQVFERDGYACTHCGKEVTWNTGHMHERVWKGRGGEVSVDNCTVLCYDCHMNDPVAGHGKRKPQFSHGQM